jgi:hypothetical protein
MVVLHLFSSCGNSIYPPSSSSSQAGHRNEATPNGVPSLDTTNGSPAVAKVHAGFDEALRRVFPLVLNAVINSTTTTTAAITTTTNHDGVVAGEVVKGSQENNEFDVRNEMVVPNMCAAETVCTDSRVDGDGVVASKQFVVDQAEPPIYMPIREDEQQNNIILESVLDNLTTTSLHETLITVETNTAASSPPPPHPRPLLCELREINVSGHSLGGALACMLGYALATNQEDLCKCLQHSNCYDAAAGVGKAIKVNVVTFGAPHVGNASFARMVANTPNLSVERIVLRIDPGTCKL